VNAWIDEAAEEARTTAPKAMKNDWLVNFDRYVAARAVELLTRRELTPRRTPGFSAGAAALRRDRRSCALCPPPRKHPT
jgi:hypothetical protein